MVVHQLGKQLRTFCLLFMLALLLCLYGIAPAKASPAKHYTDLTFAPLPEVGFPDYERYLLPNGLTVFLVEDHELPLVGGSVYIKTGERFDPADKVGLADLTLAVMRTGGTQRHSPDALNQELEQKAAVIEAAAGHAQAQAGFSALSNDLDSVFGLFTEVLREPAFAEDKLQLAINQRKGGIARRNDDPDNISRREFQDLLYGPTHPYARVQEYDTLDNITRADLQDFYARYFHPNCMILGIVGDFEPQAMKQLIQQQFGDWPGKPDASPDPLPDVQQAQTSGVFVVDQPQLTQSSVMVGQLGGQANDPDVFAMYVLNEALNSFGGRLFNEIRSRQGLAYSVYAAWQPQLDYPGLFTAGGQTRSEATVPLIQSLKTELAKLRQEPLTDPEVAFAKESILNSFVFNFVSPGRSLARLMRYEYFDYPEDYIFQYQRAVKTMTAEQVLAAAKRSLDPNKMVTLVVGNRAQIQPALETLGEQVQSVDVTIPPAS